MHNQNPLQYHLTQSINWCGAMSLITQVCLIPGNGASMWREMPRAGATMKLNSTHKDRIQNAEVKDGFLSITALKEDFQGKKYTSARLRTATKGDWLYGRLEVRAKLPDGRGMWPAIWMLSTDWKYGGWPASGEIDIMENVGYDPYVIVASAHTRLYNHVQGTQKNNKLNIPDCYTNFHVYVLEWEASEYRVFVDDQLILLSKNEGTGF